jgi:hypothetical protein
MNGWCFLLLVAGRCCRAGVGVKVERPQRSEDERPWRRRRTGSMLAARSRQDQPTVATSLRGMGGGRCAAVRGRRPALSWCAGCWPGDMMLDGVTPLAGCVRPLDLLGPTSAWTWRQGTGGSRPPHIRVVGRARTAGTSGHRRGRSVAAGHRRQRVVAQPAQQVVGAAGELASHTQRGPVATQACLDLGVVGVVG